MQVEIQPRRRNGFIVPDRDAGEPLRGDLVIGHHWVTSTVSRPAAVLHQPNNTRPDAVVAILYEPQIKTMHGARFVLTGWEIIDWGRDGKQVVVQEWPCLVTGY